MKNALKIFVLLIYGGAFLLVTGCQPSLEYESFTDLNQKGPEKFDVDLKDCQLYGQLNSNRSEGSQGAGEKSVLNRNLILTCMKNKQWILKNT